MCRARLEVPVRGRPWPGLAQPVVYVRRSIAQRTRSVNTREANCRRNSRNIPDGFEARVSPQPLPFRCRVSLSFFRIVLDRVPIPAALVPGDFPGDLPAIFRAICRLNNESHLYRTVGMLDEGQGIGRRRSSHGDPATLRDQKVAPLPSGVSQGLSRDYSPTASLGEAKSPGRPGGETKGAP